MKTDRRDATSLARLRHSGARTPVSGPAATDEAICDLARAREEVMRDLKAAKNRLQAFLLHQAIHDDGGPPGDRPTS